MTTRDRTEAEHYDATHGYSVDSHTRPTAGDLMVDERERDRAERDRQRIYRDGWEIRRQPEEDPLFDIVLAEEGLR